MFTFIESISLAGDRAKQNDDACGFAGARAWVIDGATDLHDAPLSGWASDAAWLAHTANALLPGQHGAPLKDAVEHVAQAARTQFLAGVGPLPAERWKWPIASLLLIEETGGGVSGADLGDCSVFALGADGVFARAGAAQDEAETNAARKARAAAQGDDSKPLYRRPEAMEMLRESRARLNRTGAQWALCLDPACADHLRFWALTPARPAHLLLMTDGFAALADRYRAYTAPALVRAACERGLHELGRELRAIEDADDGGAEHPRFKKSDDATAVLVRLG